MKINGKTGRDGPSFLKVEW